MGKVVPRGTLCEAAQGVSQQGPHQYRGSNETYMGNIIMVLRKQLGPFGNRIVTVRREGYMYFNQSPMNHDFKTAKTACDGRN